MRRWALGALAVAGALLVPGGAVAPATVPPTDCGFLTAKGHRYNIKSHLVTCHRSRAWSKTYITRHRRPSGWRCQDYTDSALVFRCRRGGRDFFAIKRR
jgi:hypothetical protein